MYESEICLQMSLRSPVMYVLPQERDEWVSAIEQQILSSLQLNLSDKSKVSA